MKRYVIIGGGVASVGCIEGIRSLDKKGKITLVSGEGRAPYCRPLISYFLDGKTDFNKMQYRNEDFYKENNCKILYGKAESIDVSAKTVKVKGKTYPYDELMVATGSVPFVPNFEGLDGVLNRFSFITEADAEEIDKVVTENSRVLIVGAGLIGLKCAEGLASRVKEITVCDLATRVLSSILDDDCAKLMQNRLEEHGVKFMLGQSVKRFIGNTAEMTDGTALPFDVLVTAVGVRPATDLIKAAGGETNRGIICDTSMKTSLPDVYTAGDCAECTDISGETKKVIAIWANAYLQGHTAGRNMAGDVATFDNGIPMNAIGFFGLHALTAGSYVGEMFEERGENTVKRLFVKDGYLAGFMLIGAIDRAGIYTNLIRKRIPLSEVDFDLLKLSPCLSAFDEENRRKMLGGVV